MLASSWNRILLQAVNHMKGGIVTADRVMTVSKGYAWETTTEEGGWGLNALLLSRQFKYTGVTNGVVIRIVSPALSAYYELYWSIRPNFITIMEHKSPR